MAPQRAHSHIRVTTVRNVDGRPRVAVQTRDDPAAARAAVAAAQRAPGAIAVSVDHRVSAQQTQSHDADRWAQWALNRLDAENLWAQQPGDGVTVAVVDTGVDAAHPDLAGVVLPGTDLVSPGGDGSADGNGHGTHVAGIIAAVANNGVGVAGLAQGVRILPVRVLDDNGAGWASTIAKGIIWATDHGASVVNLSLGDHASDDVTATAVQYAEDHGVVVVAAAGNDRADGDPVTYPAAYPGVIGVAATDDQDAVAAFSETGGFVDVAAPGVDIASTFPPSTYVYLSGTSMAAPFVSATAALLMAADPQLTPEQAASALESTASDLAPTGRDDASGYGLVDPAAALCSLTGCSTSTAAPAATTTRLRAGRHRATYGRWLTGRVTLRDRATGAALAGQSVRLCIQATPAERCGLLTTGSDGTAAYRLRARRNVSVYAEFPGTLAAGPSRSAGVRYRVAPRIRLRAGRHRLAVTVRPAAGQLVRLQRWTGRRWAGHGRARVGAHGHAVFTHLRHGRFRVRVRRTAGMAAGTSTARRLG
ncbi:MAG TPA: S8 family peptidase [Nocardioidaceae bacterium]|nr:S8 family peptidase [Nocardioidaceae bacterium]